MVRIEAASRPATIRRPERSQAEASRALVVLPPPASASAPRAAGGASTRGDGRPQAGFVAHLIVSADPTLAPSRGERARRACGLYAAAAARQVA